MGEACADLPAADQEACMNPASPFAAILEQVMALGGFPEAAAVILYTSALAAIVSLSPDSESERCLHLQHSCCLLVINLYFYLLLFHHDYR
jgi:hypothetical protein